MLLLSLARCCIGLSSDLRSRPRHYWALTRGRPAQPRRFLASTFPGFEYRLTLLLSMTRRNGYSDTISKRCGTFASFGVPCIKSGTQLLQFYCNSTNSRKSCGSFGFWPVSKSESSLRVVHGANCFFFLRSHAANQRRHQFRLFLWGSSNMTPALKGVGSKADDSTDRLPEWDSDKGEG